MNIKKGDKVKILSGKDRGKTGKVLKVYPPENRVVVEGVNMVKKHRKSTQRGQKGERISFEAPLNVSNVQLICSACGKPSRVGKKEVEGKRVRVCKKCQAEV
jgi:large subunit ribosomal protein L24